MRKLRRSLRTPPRSSDRPQRFPRCGDCLIDVVLGMGRRDKSGFELAARKVNAASQHPPEEAREEPRVAGTGVLVVLDGPVMEEQRQHAADSLNAVRNPRICGGAIQSLGETC